eukprot:scaffold1401_cov330-Pavlova_lutheri.AAC.29
MSPPISGENAARSVRRGFHPRPTARNRGINAAPSSGYCQLLLAPQRARFSRSKICLSMLVPVLSRHGLSTVLERSLSRNSWGSGKGRPCGFDWIDPSFGKEDRSGQSDGDGDGAGEAVMAHESACFHDARMDGKTRRKGVR